MDKVPADLKHYMAVFLKPADLLNLALVSKSFRSIFRANGAWKRQVAWVLSFCPEMHPVFEKYTGRKEATHQRVTDAPSQAKRLKRPLGAKNRGHWYVFVRFLIGFNRASNLYCREAFLKKNPTHVCALAFCKTLTRLTMEEALRKRISNMEYFYIDKAVIRVTFTDWKFTHDFSLHSGYAFVINVRNGSTLVHFKAGYGSDRDQQIRRIVNMEPPNDMFSKYTQRNAN
jgi:hypothetical protein